MHIIIITQHHNNLNKQTQFNNNRVQLGHNYYV